MRQFFLFSSCRNTIQSDLNQIQQQIIFQNTIFTSLDLVLAFSQTFVFSYLAYLQEQKKIAFLVKKLGNNIPVHSEEVLSVYQTEIIWNQCKLAITNQRPIRKKNHKLCKTGMKNQPINDHLSPSFPFTCFLFKNLNCTQLLKKKKKKTHHARRIFGIDTDEKCPSKLFLLKEVWTPERQPSFCMLHPKFRSIQESLSLQNLYLSFFHFHGGRESQVNFVANGLSFFHWKHICLSCAIWKILHTSSLLFSVTISPFSPNTSPFSKRQTLLKDLRLLNWTTRKILSKSSSPPCMVTTEIWKISSIQQEDVFPFVVIHSHCQNLQDFFF